MSASVYRVALAVFVVSLLILTVASEFTGVGTPGFGSTQVLAASLSVVLLIVASSETCRIRLGLAFFVGLSAVLIITFGHHFEDLIKAEKPGTPYAWIDPSPLDHSTDRADLLFTIVVLPDTQNYTWRFPRLLDRQIEWIVENVEARKIEFVLHTGDVTEHNSAEEWRRARNAFSALENVVPYAMVVGNHDYGKDGRTDARESLFSHYFPVAHFRTFETYGGTCPGESEKSENSYHIFEAAGTQWLVLALELGPRDEVLQWANAVVRDHPEHRAILLTHIYLDYDSRRFDHKLKVPQKNSPHSYGIANGGAGVNDGQEMWDNLVSKHPNFVLVVNGHVAGDGIGLLSSIGDAGNIVHQMAVNYQNVENGGNGWLRLLEFLRDGRIRVRDYSPLLGVFNKHPMASFELPSHHIVAF